MLYIILTCSLGHVVLWTYLLQRPLFRRELFPLVEQSLHWTLGRNLSIWSPVDAAVVNGKYFPGEVACLWELLNSRSLVGRSREKLNTLLRTSCLPELILDCFEAQFNHTVFIFHSLKWDLLNFRSFVGKAENIIKGFLSVYPFFEAQFNHTGFYLPYFKSWVFHSAHWITL